MQLLRAQGWERIYDQGVIDQVLVLPGDELILNHSLSYSKSDPAGELQWTKAMRQFNTGEVLGQDQVVRHPSGQFAVFQNVSSFGFFGSLSSSVYDKLHLAEFDDTGAKLWENEFNPDPDTTFGGGVRMINAADGGYLLLARKNSDNLIACLQADFCVLQLKTYTKLIKIDAQGNPQWSRVHFPNGGGSLRPRDIQAHPAGGYAVLVESLNHDLLRVDGQGEEVTRLTVDFPNDGDFRPTRLEVLPDGRYLILGQQTGPETNTPFVAEIAPGGQLNWLTLLDHLGNANATDFLRRPDGRILVLANRELLNGQSEPALTALGPDGNVQWSRSYPTSFSSLAYSLGAASAGGYYIGGSRRGFYTPGGPLTSKGLLMKTDSLGFLYPNFLEGNVFEDIDGDCAPIVEAPLAGWLVSVTGDQEYHALTDSSGKYALSLDTGSYQVQVFPPSNLWTPCAPVQAITVAPYDTVAALFPIQTIAECALLQVDISTPFLRRCFDNTYTVNYCNVGTAPAYDAYVEVTLDPHLTYLSATAPLLGQQGDTYTFDVGHLDVGDCGRFTIDVNVDCDSTVLGQTHCVEAHIFPDSLCVYSANWSGASVEVDASCEGDSLSFSIRNVGTAPTQPALQYQVIEDQVILQQEEFQLAIAEVQSFKVAATGTTLRLEAEQEPFHPGNSMPSVTVEGCGAPFPNPGSLGFATQYWEDDGNAFISIDCQENIGSYDPNDKRGFPKGYGDERYVEPGQEIEYHIRFQNTGTDTAFKVVILDQLAEALDITTVRPGAASHPYNFRIREGRVLEFAFNPIALPDSNVNEAASHGFVKFRVAQKPGNPPGTEIRNTAAIYFDFNPPIITNTTVHRIAEDFVEVFVLDAETTVLELSVAPNPFSETARFDLRPLDFYDFALEEEEFHLSIFDTQGRLVRRDRFYGPSYEFHRQRLTEGLYFFRITWNGRRVSSGKVVVQ